MIWFLAAVLVLARLCDDEGLFRACGAWTARAAAGRPRRLLAAVFGLASAITAVLSLDATIVLLTPVVLATAARMGARAKPHVYACTHLSNTASLLLPVSNLTNLLAFAASGLSFTRFAALMALPWLAAIAVEYAVFRRFFATDLDARVTDPDAGVTDPDAAAVDLDAAATAPDAPTAVEPPLPLFPLLTVAGTLAGFLLASAVGVDPAWAATAGALLLAVRALIRRRTTALGLLRAASLPFLANVINNLPAVLVLLPLTAPTGPGAVLAVLIGVNIGPNLTYAGSLATLLWRRILHQHEHEVDLGEFTRLGLLTVPAALTLAVVALWGGALHFS
ncbi:arsenic transporter [Streptomyces nigrescens]|uniref:Arsenic transporter n=1 Tax=Streptomyces nigrescens TaxID=1920 RepID=A0ABM8A3L0_STRNI|nr:arsenic transporter [Streptomyces nigrescens]